MIGSGYNKEILPHAWFALLAGLGDFSIPVEEPVHIPTHHRGDPSLNETKEMVRKAKKIMKDYWNCLAT